MCIKNYLMKLIDLLAVSGWRIVGSSIKMNPNV